jgi:hypothetical protein
METNHIEYTRPTSEIERPKFLPLLTEDDFCKAKYSQNDKRCYTARLLDIFLTENYPFVAAYKEFRLATMDYLYKHHSDDHASNAKQRAEAFNAVAKSLGYLQVDMQEFTDYMTTLTTKSK